MKPQPDMKKEGVKFDGDKVRMELLPFDALEGVAKVLTFGAKKYDDRNWELGMDHERLLGATLRHQSAILQGELIDPESGLPHIDHAICGLMMVSAYYKRGMVK